MALSGLHRPGDGGHEAGTRARAGGSDRVPMLGDMTLQRMDNVLIVVDDLEAAKAFFAELGMELEGEATNEGRWVDRVVGLDGVRADLAMMRTPDGHGGLELAKFHTPPAGPDEPGKAPPKTLGVPPPLFAGRGIDDV